MVDFRLRIRSVSGVCRLLIPDRDLVVLWGTKGLPVGGQVIEF
jgi:hypothetical protein